jgi:hypothetical protein
MFKYLCCSGTEVGDLCNEDFDGDGFPDKKDSCPHVDNIHKTSFLNHFIVWLDGQSTDNDVWKISNEVKILDTRNGFNGTRHSCLVALIPLPIS